MTLPGSGGWRGLPLRDKVAVVTGASGDLGSAMAGALAEAGAKVVLAARDVAALEAAAQRLAVESARLLVIPVDVTDVGQVQALMSRTVEQLGRIDVLVTAAGVQVRKPAVDLTKEEWEAVLNVNLSGTFFCCQAAGRYMIRQRAGKVIMVSSLTAEIGLPNMAAYVATRGGIRQLCKALAVEWSPVGINVNCLGPGRFRTRMTESIFADAATRASFLNVIPMKRAGVPSDLAGATVFLASDASSYITGQSLYIDGGWLAAGGNPLA